MRLSISELWSSSYTSRFVSSVHLNFIRWINLCLLLFYLISSCRCSYRRSCLVFMTLSFPLRICAAQCFSAEYGTRCSARSAETRESIQLPRTKSKRVRQKTAKRMPIRRTSKCLVHQVYTTQRAYYHCLSFNRFLENWFHFFFTGVQTSLFSISSQWCAWFLFPGANWAWFIFYWIREL